MISSWLTRRPCHDIGLLDVQVVRLHFLVYTCQYAGSGRLTEQNLRSGSERKRYGKFVEHTDVIGLVYQSEHNFTQYHESNPAFQYELGFQTALNCHPRNLVSLIAFYCSSSECSVIMHNA